MRVPKLFATLAALIGPLWLAEAAAQIPMYTLPKDDFRWNWGTSLDQQRGFADIEISGSESFFRCDFSARMRPSSPMSSAEIRDLENQLRSRLDFIYAVSETMYYLDLNRAVAVAMRDGPAAGLSLVDELLKRGELAEYHLAHAARADLCRRLGKAGDARAAYQRALELTNLEPERRFLERRIAELANG